MRAFLCLPSHPGVTTPLPILAFGSWDHQDTQALLLEVKSDMIHNIMILCQISLFTGTVHVYCKNIMVSGMRYDFKLQKSPAD